MIFFWIILFIIIATALLLFLPLKGRQHPAGFPEKHRDERDTMFSRNEISPGEKRFEEYYRNHPENKEKDDRFSSKPGLLIEHASNYSRYPFACAEASFEAVEAFFLYRDDRTGAAFSAPDSPWSLSEFIKRWALKVGAHSAGITEMKDYHFYTYGGRRERYGRVGQVPELTDLASTRMKGPGGAPVWTGAG